NRVNVGGPSRSKYPTQGGNQKGKHQYKKPYSRPSGNNQDQRPYRPIASAVGNGANRNQNQEFTRRCFKCGKPDHLANSCPVDRIVCFKCGNVGHMSRDCSNQRVDPVVNNVRATRQKENGRVYTLSGVEASQSEDLIQGSCNMAGNLLTVLFDSGATHSFISMDRVKQLKLPVTPLPYDLIISTPTAKPLM
ncbi:hypothetical protein L195_g056836, partial [Trifolium pratense]